jgi:hypothetical protein
MLCFMLPAAAAETVIREGTIYATVDREPDGSMSVTKIESDLPESVNPAITDWIEQQSVDPGIERQDEGTLTMPLQVKYKVFESAAGEQLLGMEVGIAAYRVLQMTQSGESLGRVPDELSGTTVDVKFELTAEGKPDHVRLEVPEDKQHAMTTELKTHLLESIYGWRMQPIFLDGEVLKRTYTVPFTYAKASSEQLAEDRVPIDVRFKLLESGKVGWVRLESELPDGMNEERVERSVKEMLESNPNIRRSAEDGTLPGGINTLTVKLRVPAAGTD